MQPEEFLSKLRERIQAEVQKCDARKAQFQEEMDKCHDQRVLLDLALYQMEAMCGEILSCLPPVPSAPTQAVPARETVRDILSGQEIPVSFSWTPDPETQDAKRTRKKRANNGRETGVADKIVEILKQNGGQIYKWALTNEMTRQGFYKKFTMGEAHKKIASTLSCSFHADKWHLTENSVILKVWPVVPPERVMAARQWRPGNPEWNLPSAEGGSL